jgi:signal peptidase I
MAQQRTPPDSLYDDDDDLAPSPRWEDDPRDPHSDLTDASADAGWAQAPDDDFPEYRGEVRERRRGVITALAWTCPGLAYGYVGEFVAAVLVNTSFVLSVTLFMALWTRLRFFPLWPALVLAGGWAVAMAWVRRDALRRASEAQPYLLRPVNHGVVYAALALLTFALPLLSMGWFASARIWGGVWSGDEAMYPSVAAGDLLLVDRTAYRQKPPARGDLVMAIAPDGEALLGRVVGVAGDRVQLENGWPVVGARPLDRYDGGDLASLMGGSLRGLDAPWSGAPEGALVRFEVPHRMGSFETGEPGRWYPILTSPDAERVTPGAFQRSVPIDVEEGEVLLLNDNRTLPMIPDHEAAVGRRVPLDWVEGRPLYVLLSQAPDGAWRWERVGMRLR